MNERNRTMENKATLLSGGGGLVSTMDDFSKFCNMLLNKGTYVGCGSESIRILSVESVVEMTTNHLIAKDGENTDELLHYAYDNSFSESIGGGIGFGYGMSVVTR